MPFGRVIGSGDSLGSPNLEPLGTIDPPLSRFPPPAGRLRRTGLGAIWVWTVLSAGES
jgi:hypothetical protein